MFDCFWLSVPVQLIAWKDSSPNDLLCVEWDVKPYTLTHSWCFWLCLSVSESVNESMRPNNLVNTVCQKLVKGISPNFGHHVYGLIDKPIRLWGRKVKGQGHSRQWPEKLDEYNNFVTIGANSTKIKSRGQETNWLGFLANRSKVKVTAAGNITVDNSPSTSI